MKAEEIAVIVRWVKSTDLIAVGLRDGSVDFSFSTADDSGAGTAALPPRYQCLSAPAVGLFQWSAPGRPKKIEEGDGIRAGDAVGLIETLPGKTTPVTAPASGKVARVLVEAPAPVAYGQPILFIEPDGA